MLTESIDGIVHVDPTNALGEIAMAAFFNPTTQHLNTTIMLPLYRLRGIILHPSPSIDCCLHL